MLLRDAFLMVRGGWHGISAFEEIIEFCLEEGVAFVVLEDVLHAAGQEGRFIDAVLVLLRSGRELPDGARGESISGLRERHELLTLLDGC